MRTAAREVLVDLSRRNLFLLFELLNRKQFGGRELHSCDLLRRAGAAKRGRR